MIKKLFPFAYCLVPFGAIAADVPGCVIENGALVCTPGTGSAVGGNGELYSLAATASQPIVVKNGKGVVISKDSGGNSGGFSVANNMFIGQNSTGSVSGDFFAEEAVNSIFTLQSDGNISVGGLLTVVDGYTFGINTHTNGAEIDVKLGDVDAAGKLLVENVQNFESKSIDTASELGISAKNITTGAINATGGDVNLTATGKVIMDQIQMGLNGGDTTIMAGTKNAQNIVAGTGSIESGNIQNNATNGAMVIKTGGDLAVKDKRAISTTNNIGSVENSGKSLTINVGGNMAVDGTMKNDSNDGTMIITAQSLTVDGGDDTNRSFVNAGTLDMTITGETNLAYGFDLSRMTANDSFSLDTGTLVLGSTSSEDAWLQVFAKDLKSFKVKIRQGNVTAADIINGSADNTVANMEILGKSVTADSVQNNGRNLEIRGTDANGTVKISGAVAGKTAASTTTIVSAGKLDIDGNISNAGKMVLNGNNVELYTVSNTGNEMEISSLTDTTGKITIATNVTNANGTMTINARQIQIDGSVKNTGGNMIIKGSDANSGAYVKLGSVEVEGGTLKMDALIQGISITDSLYVNNGALNVGQATHNLTVGNDILIGNNLTLSGTDVTGAGNTNIAAYGPSGFVMTSENGGISIDGDITATETGAARSAQFVANTIEVGMNNSGTVTGGNITVQNSNNKLVFGNSKNQKTTIHGDVSVTDGGAIELWSDDATVGSLSGNGLVVTHGKQILAENGDIDITGNLLFDGTDATSGLVVKSDTTNLTLKSDTGSVGVSGGAIIADGNTLTLVGEQNATIGGQISVAQNATLNMSAKQTATLGSALVNDGTINITDTGAVSAGSITNNNKLTINASGNVSTGSVTNKSRTIITTSGDFAAAGAVSNTANVMDITAKNMSATALSATAGTTNLDVTSAVIGGAIGVSGDLYQGTLGSGRLNIARNNSTISGNSLTVAGNMIADANYVTYRITNGANITGDIRVNNADAGVELYANTISAGYVSNSGTLKLSATESMSLGTVVSDGALTLDSGQGIANVIGISIDGGTLELAGAGLTAKGTANDNQGTFSATGTLYQNYTGTLAANDVNVLDTSYAITAGNLEFAGINQKSGAMTLNTSDLKVHGDLNAKDLRVAANPATNWLNVGVDGSVLGGAQFIGLESMKIGGNYIFDNKSQIEAAILSYADGLVMNSAFPNYWSTISLNDDNTLGVITNPTDAAPLISVGGAFSSVADTFDVANNGHELEKPQVGLVLRDIVDQGTAIWLLKANEGIADDDASTKIRNVNVSFCNADGTICYNYLDSLNLLNGSNEDLPAYITARDTTGNGKADSLYVVFDPRFGGPLQAFKIQPIVARVDDHTKGEYESAGALDDLVAGQIYKSGFYNRTPIEVIPLVFQKTNMKVAAKELYDRMEYYNMNRDGTALARFSRLFQVREAEQIVGDIVLNEHTNSRSFEDRMFDEFIWNRNRNLKKAWADVDYGMMTQNARDNKHIGGHRVNVAGGFDWQESQTLLLGLTGRISYMESKNSDSMDLGYLPGQHINGHVRSKVADTDIGLGGYLMKLLGNKTRIYGNGIFDIHVLSVERDQNFMSRINGKGTAFSLTSEWGLLHDMLNQYVVGNIYARAGYNTGFSVTEKSAGSDYMKLKSDGYFSLVPGYSLMVQKRIYPSAWFQVRPYASVGVEYDVLGAPHEVKYKFAPATTFTSYDVRLDPFWANIGGGVELVAASGVQVGLDYRYQYNPEIQLHNIRVSGSYRF